MKEIPCVIRFGNQNVFYVIKVYISQVSSLLVKLEETPIFISLLGKNIDLSNNGESHLMQCIRDCEKESNYVPYTFETYEKAKLVAVKVTSISFSLVDFRCLKVPV